MHGTSSHKENLRPGKITYSDSNFWPIEYKGELMPKIKPKAEIKEGTILTKYPQNREVLSILYEGTLALDIEKGEKVSKDQVISTSGKIIKKEISFCVIVNALS